MNETILSSLDTLRRLSVYIDPPVKLFLDSQRRYQGKSWFGVVRSLPFTSIKDTWQNVSKGKGFLFSAVPVVVTGLAGIYGAFFNTSKLDAHLEIGQQTFDFDPNRWLAILSLAIGGFLLWYVLGCLYFFFMRMPKLEDKYFHVDVYRILRPSEFKMFFGFTSDNFSFQTIYNLLNSALTTERDTAETVEVILEKFLHIEREEFKEKITELEGRNLDLQNSFDELEKLSDQMIQHAIESKERSDQAALYLTELLQIANRVLFRMHNGYFDATDLKIITGFTLYQLSDPSLRKLVDIGTSGISPEWIDLQDETYTDWSVVSAAKGRGDAIRNEPREDKVIVSYRFHVSSDVLWIYNFHINKNTDQKAMDLILRDIIETKAVYDLIHAICLHLHRSELLIEEDDPHADSAS